MSHASSRRRRFYRASLPARRPAASSLAAGAGIVGVVLGVPLADPIAGLVSTVAIPGIVWEVGRGILSRVLDAIEPETVEAIEKIAAGAAGVKGVHDVRARRLGHNITVELHVTVEGSLSVIRAHAIGEEVRRELLAHLPKIAESLSANPVVYEQI